MIPNRIARPSETIARVMVPSARTCVVGNPLAGLQCLSWCAAIALTPVPPPIACLSGRFRRIRCATACVRARSSILYRQVPRRPELARRGPLPLLQRRRSRYLPVTRRSAVVCLAYQSRGLPDFLQAGRPWASRAEIFHLAYPNMPCDRGACGMPSSFAFPIGLRHPDLARRQQSRSRPSFRRQP